MEYSIPPAALLQSKYKGFSAGASSSSKFFWWTFPETLRYASLPLMDSLSPYAKLSESDSLLYMYSTHTQVLVLGTFFFEIYSPPRPRVLILYLYSSTVWSAAPQTTLWGRPRPRFEPGMADLEAETLTTRPTHLLGTEGSALLLNLLLLFCFVCKKEF